jgi:hypothetical protein
MSAEASVQEGERPFGLDELFFSTTDPGGRIVTGNPVFARVSGYLMDELVGGHTRSCATPGCRASPSGSSSGTWARAAPPPPT